MKPSDGEPSGGVFEGMELSEAEGEGAVAIVPPKQSVFEVIYFASRLGWQSIRIVISLVQVVSQLGSVLEFEFPDILKGLFDLFRFALGDCLG